MRPIQSYLSCRFIPNLLVGSVALALLTSAGMVGAQTSPASDPTRLRLPYIELSAQASRTVANDLARASAFVEMSEANPAELARKVNARIAEALALAKSNPAVKVRTGSNFSYPVYGKSGRTIESWRMRAEIALESRDIAALSELAGKIQSIAAISQLNVEVAPDTYRKAEDEAMVDAIQAFQARAAVAAKALGKRYRIGNLSLGGVDARPMQMMKAARPMAAAMDAAPLPIEAGESTVTVTVSGSVELIDN